MRSQESRTKTAAAMRKAWARARAEGRTGQWGEREKVACSSCGRVFLNSHVVRHRRNCFASITEFLQLYSDRILIDAATGCLVWTGPKSGGRPNTRNNVNAARRLLEIELERKLLPWPNECALHTCDNELCVNIDHLWVGSQGENMADMARKGRSSRVPSVPKLPSILGVCSACGKTVEIEGTRYNRLREVICSKECGRRLRTQRGLHTRWHVNRGVTKEGCAYCSS